MNGFLLTETLPRPKVSVLRGNVVHRVHTVQVGGRPVAVHRFQPEGPADEAARVPNGPAEPVPELPQVGHEV